MSLITNRELAENPTFVVAITWSQCTRCGYLTGPITSHQAWEACRMCGSAQGMRGAWPDLSAIKLLQTVCYFYATADRRAEGVAERLRDGLSALSGKLYSVAGVTAAQRAVERAYNKHRDDPNVLGKLETALERVLGSGSNGSAQQVLFMMTMNTSSIEEHNAVVVIGCTLLEKLLHDLIAAALVMSGMGRREAMDAANATHGFTALKDRFKGATALDLASVVEDNGSAKYWNDWRKVVERRNLFIHGLPYAVGASQSESTFCLARDAFGIFARMTNYLFTVYPDYAAQFTPAP